MTDGINTLRYSDFSWPCTSTEEKVAYIGTIPMC